MKESPEDGIHSEDKAQEIRGRRVLVAIPYVNHEGNLTQHKQIHGVVGRVSRGEGVVREPSDGTEHRLPPDRRAFHHAEPGTYSLRSTGEPVVTPDYPATCNVEKTGRA